MSLNSKEFVEAVRAIEAEWVAVAMKGDAYAVAEQRVSALTRAMACLSQGDPVRKELARLIGAWQGLLNGTIALE